MNVVEAPAPIIETPLGGANIGRQPLLSGTGAPGAHVRVLRSNSRSVIAETDVDAYGHWEVVGSPQAIGSLSISAHQIVDGHTSPWAPNRPMRIIETPSAPVIDTPLEGADVGRQPLLSGMGVPGAHVRVLRSNSRSVIAETEVDAYGHWEVVGSPQAIGSLSISAQQIVDGNTSPWAPNRVVRVIEAATALVIDTPLEGVDVGRQPLLAGTGVSDTHVRVLRSNSRSVIAETDVDAYGHWGGDGHVSPWVLNRRIHLVENLSSGAGLSSRERPSHDLMPIVVRPKWHTEATEFGERSVPWAVAVSFDRHLLESARVTVRDSASISRASVSRPDSASGCTRRSVTSDSTNSDDCLEFETVHRFRFTSPKN